MIRFQPYRKRRSYALAILLVLLAFFISFSSVRDLFGVRSVLLAAIYPFQFTAVTLWKGITGIPASVINLRNLYMQNSELKKELDSLKPRLIVLEGLNKESNRLRDAMAISQRNLLAARVIGKAPSPWFSILEINQGSQAGIRNNLPVITKDGLAGKIVEIARFSSKVMLLIDAESSVAAVNTRSRDYGIAAGNLSNRLSMKYVGIEGDIKEGDAIATSQISSIFPPGIPIGTVVRVSKAGHDLFYHIEIKPAVDFSKIEEVFVVF